MRLLSLTILVLLTLACGLVSGESLLNSQYSAAVVRPARLAGDLQDDSRDAQQFLEMLAEAVVKGINQLHMVPAVAQQRERTTGFYASEIAPHLLECVPVVTELSQRVSESSGTYIIEATIALEVRLGDETETFEIKVIGFGEHKEEARNRATEQYVRQIGYLFAEEIQPETAVQIESFFNGYVTGGLPSESQVRPGDEYIVYKNGVEESALLRVAHLLPESEESPPAAQFALQYAEVPLSVGAVLHPRSAQRSIPISYYLRQGLGSFEIGVDITASKPEERFGLIGGISTGYAWGGFNEFSRVTEELPRAWISLSAGGVYTYKPGAFRVEGPGVLRSPYWFQAASTLEFGTYFERQRFFVGSSWSFRVGRYQSSNLEVGIAVGLSQRWLLQSSGSRIRSAVYIGPFVTFR
ncbi:MAG: hypothetical protein ACQEQU_02380 [Spirochaetota bacterium]